MISAAGLDGFIGMYSMFSSFDEIYCIREVKNILESDGIKPLVLNIVAGKGYIYGRLMHMLNSALCAIPYHLFGMEGLVFTMRMAHCIYLFVGLWLVTRYVVANHVNQILAFLVLLVLPVTLYFMGIPKPEALQVLLIGVFIYLKDKYSWAWIFLGLALGSKVSIAFSVLVVGIYEVMKDIKTHQIWNLFAKGIWAMAGLFIALPALPLAILNANFRYGLQNIIATTKKPYDDQSINFFSWLHKWFDYFSELPQILSYFLVLTIFIASIIYFVRFKSKRYYILFAYAALLPIMLMTKRLWEHYLFLGTAMLLPLVFEVVQSAKWKMAKYALFILFFIQVIFHTRGVQRASGELQSAEEVNIKNKTLELVETALENYPNKRLGIDIMLYYNYSWIGNEQITTVNFREFQEVDYLILPDENNYNLPAEFIKKESIGNLVLYAR